ncbi:MAG: hydroxysqualene dehydroxylase HpnE [Ottowia sp.]|uniref:hydroxysqualene dehydroxylase HpnE n=1 Tax=Ottowia sp. TaxID=1898956 RepID=UPI0039E57BF1
MNSQQHIAIIGAGWAGLAAAVRAVELGHRVTVFEAARSPGGRARAVPLALPGGGTLVADNGQHILIGAYTATLALMRAVGVDPAQALQRLPLTLRYPDGSGLALPRLRPPLDAAAGILTARGWRWAERLALLRAAADWRRGGFACDASLTVAGLCAHLPARVMQDFIEPLCVAALNTPVAEASALVFLRVLQDALLGPPGSADLLLPRTDLGALLPDPALRWLRERGAAVHLGRRVEALHAQAPHWRIDGQDFDHVVLALPAPAAARVLAASTAPPPLADALHAWGASAAALRHEAIATVYTLADSGLPAPMLALRANGGAPAQFVFDRGALPGSPAARLLAFVASAARSGSAELEQAVLRQAQTQLGLTVRPLRTVTEKRATFACTPGLRRPPMRIAPSLLACGDFIDGPYPATLEGAARSGEQAAKALR